LPRPTAPPTCPQRFRYGYSPFLPAASPPLCPRGETDTRPPSQPGRGMSGGAALASQPQPSAPPSQPQQQQQQAREQLKKAVEMNAVRLQAIGERIRGHFRGGS
uniref:Uncharacterized protein n=1 Tax=Aegilops tauschii subsp. strangulata TaxID=200361 RepID=A0A453QTS3_AEGTS